MSQQGVTDWNSPAIPPTIRRPWRVFEEDLEDQVAEAASQSEEAAAHTRERIAAVQAKGAKLAFASLPEAEQRTYMEVSIQELAAFVCWRRTQAARQERGEVPPTEFEAGWDLLDIEEKAEWLPEDCWAALAADAQWAGLLADKPQVPTQPLKGEQKKAPLKQEPKKTDSVQAPAPTGKKAPKQEKQSVAAPKAEAKKIGGYSCEAVVKQEPKQQAPAKPAPKAQAQETSKKAASVKLEPKESAPAKPANAQEATKQQAATDAKSTKAVHVKKELGQPAPAKPAPKAQVQDKPKAVVKQEPKQQAPAKPAPKAQAQEATRPPAKQAPKAPAKLQEPQPAEGRRSKAKAAEKAAGEKASRPPKEPKEPKEPKAPKEQKEPKPKAPKEQKGPKPKELTKAKARQRDEEDELPLVPQDAGAPRARRGRGGKAVPENLYPEALKAHCCKCSSDAATDANDLGMCDRCDKAFHQKCHDPPVKYFGHPDDQWFCGDCTLELAQMRKLSLQVNAFCWVQNTGESTTWPAQVLRIDFSSLADPKPYWVQYFDAGPPEGAWVGEVHVRAWTSGPRFSALAQARRRNAVRLAEAAGAPRLSEGESQGPAPKSPRRKRPVRDVVQDPAEEMRPRRSRRGEGVELLTELPAGKPKRKARESQVTQELETGCQEDWTEDVLVEPLMAGPCSPKRRRVVEEDPGSTEKRSPPAREGPKEDERGRPDEGEVAKDPTEKPPPEDCDTMLPRSAVEIVEMPKAWGQDAFTEPKEREADPAKDEMLRFIEETQEQLRQCEERDRRRALEKEAQLQEGALVP
ncbi:unnamed protein product [Effrenium voratum]|uniref:PHD-type domain-containing protein n=1 Tax=Effrenium voratum TaxID=2562239 RepID=A0AA36IBB2_9DINO|nr:unnamed protein product [Effrenium voratum]